MPMRKPNQLRRAYVEAFPTLAILEVERMVRAGRRLCLFSDEHDQEIGIVRVIDLASDRLLIAQSFCGTASTPATSSGSTEFDLVRSERVSEHSRPAIICGRCERNVEKIYHAYTAWACRTCHGLTHVSQCGGAVVALLRERDDLQRRIGRGRERYGRKAAFEKMRRRYGEVLSALVNADPELPVDLSYAVRGEWVANQPVEEVSKPDPLVRGRADIKAPGFSLARQKRSILIKPWWGENY